ncbi:MAG: hypothetical protein JWR63_3394 [Conexibacter sp.]|nr:hypothetical protein [Conexibacter sp.]
MRHVTAGRTFCAGYRQPGQDDRRGQVRGLPERRAAARRRPLGTSGAELRAECQADQETGTCTGASWRKPAVSEDSSMSTFGVP